MRLPTQYEVIGYLVDIDAELAKHGDTLRAALVCYRKLTGVDVSIDKDLGKSDQDRAAMILMYLCDAFIDGQRDARKGAEREARLPKKATR